MRIGVYSGSFNPVHVGHIALCDYLVANDVVDEVWLIRSPLNPLKVGCADSLAPDADREAMLRLAAEGHRGMRICTIEDDLPRPNYSVNTFRALEAQYPGNELHLIIGADNWLHFDQWRSYEEFLTRYHLIVYPRPGYTLDDAARLRYGAGATRNVRFVDAPQYDISSTQLRQAIARHDDAGLTMIDPKVLQYIRQHQLYQ